VLPAAMKTTSTPFDRLLGAVELRQMVLVESHRVGRESGTHLFDRPPAARALERDDGSLPALKERIAELTASIRARFDQTAPMNQPAAPQAGKSSASVASGVCGPSTPVVAGDDPLPAVGTNGALVDLRGRDLGVPKEPEEQ